MTTQRLTVVKIAGVASEATLELFRSWQSERRADDPNELSPEQWPEEVRARADQWALNLRPNAHRPPILFFAEYVDLWSFCPPSRILADHDLISVAANQYQLYCLPLPAPRKLSQYLSKLRAKGQWFEDRLFATLTIEAIAAWDTMIDRAVLIYLREVFGGATEDEEVEQSLTTVPPWLDVDPVSRDDH